MTNPFKPDSAASAGRPTYIAPPAAASTGGRGGETRPRFSLDPPRKREILEDTRGIDRFGLATKELLYTGARIAVGATMGPPAAVAVLGSAVSAAAGGTGSAGAETNEGDYLTRMAQIQEEGRVANAELFEAQHRIQEENRRFSCLSNVLRAKHDTAKAAVGNIRA